jgi:hypothetical protein
LLCTTLIEHVRNCIALLLLLSGLSWLSWLAWLTRLLLRLLLCLRNNISSILQVVVVVGEEIVLFAIDLRLHDVSGLLSFLLEHLGNDIHHITNHGGESGEDSLYNALGHLFKLVIDILQEIKCWFSELLKLRLDQVDEDIN